MTINGGRINESVEFNNSELQPLAREARR